LSICNDVDISSGALMSSHPCSAWNNGGAVNITCLRALIEGSEVAGGYHVTTSTDTHGSHLAWLYGTDVQAAWHPNHAYQCWGQSASSPSPAISSPSPPPSPLMHSSPPPPSAPSPLMHSSPPPPSAPATAITAGGIGNAGLIGIIAGAVAAIAGMVAAIYKYRSDKLRHEQHMATIALANRMTDHSQSTHGAQAPECV